MLEKVDQGQREGGEAESLKEIVSSREMRSGSRERQRGESGEGEGQVRMFSIRSKLTWVRRIMQLQMRLRPNPKFKLKI